MTPSHSKSVLIIGSMAFDDLELPSGSFTDVVGGSATYCAYAASLFAKASVVAVVGADFPKATLDSLGRRGVNTEGIEQVPGKTFRWKGRYASNLASRTTLDTQLNVFADFRPKLPNNVRKCTHLLLGNIHPALQLEVLDQVENPEFVAADTMNFWIEGERATLERVLKRIGCLVVNDEEIRQLSGEHNIKKAAARVQQMGPKRVIVKRGEYGALLFDEHGVFFAPAYPLEAEVDPTGAGDTFAGAFMGFLASEGEYDRSSLRRALMMAATVASFCVESVGTERLASLGRDDVAARLDSLRSLVHFGA
ncbi:MAG: PfkB family carbohydrate kinase [Polyangiaceae bacterium]|nr:PfkB family carbohydrate kinase [Polyangiaceae bacterium]